MFIVGGEIFHVDISDEHPTEEQFSPHLESQASSSSLLLAFATLDSVCGEMGDAR